MKPEQNGKAPHRATFTTLDPPPVKTPGDAKEEPPVDYIQIGSQALGNGLRVLREGLRKLFGATASAAQGTAGVWENLSRTAAQKREQKVLEAKECKKRSKTFTMLRARAQSALEQSALEDGVEPPIGLPAALHPEWKALARSARHATESDRRYVDRLERDREALLDRVAWSRDAQAGLGLSLFTFLFGLAILSLEFAVLYHLMRDYFGPEEILASVSTTLAAGLVLEVLAMNCAAVALARQGGGAWLFSVVLMAGALACIRVFGLEAKTLADTTIPLFARGQVAVVAGTGWVQLTVLALTSGLILHQAKKQLQPGLEAWLHRRRLAGLEDDLRKHRCAVENAVALRFRKQLDLLAESALDLEKEDTPS